MNGSLIDTGIIVKVLRGDAKTVDFLNSLGSEVFISVVVVGELLFGANKSIKTEQNKQLVREQIDRFEILSIDMEIAKMYGQIKIDLMKSGFTIPENDLWIAATAQKYGLALATFDNHFKYINSIQTVSIE